jgi:hypothetical protein
VDGGNWARSDEFSELDLKTLLLFLKKKKQKDFYFSCRFTGLADFQPMPLCLLALGGFHGFQASEHFA